MTDNGENVTKKIFPVAGLCCSIIGGIIASIGTIMTAGLIVITEDGPEKGLSLYELAPSNVLFLASLPLLFAALGIGAAIWWRPKHLWWIAIVATVSFIVTSPFIHLSTAKTIESKESNAITGTYRARDRQTTIWEFHSDGKVSASQPEGELMGTYKWLDVNNLEVKFTSPEGRTVPQVMQVRRIDGIGIYLEGDAEEAPLFIREQ